MVSMKYSLLWKEVSRDVCWPKSGVGQVRPRGKETKSRPPPDPHDNAAFSSPTSPSHSQAEAGPNTRSRLIRWLLSFPRRCSRTASPSSMRPQRQSRAPVAHNATSSQGWLGPEGESTTGVGGRGEERT